MDTSDSPRLSRTAADAVEWVNRWPVLWPVAPQYLQQPILPGWTFNINSNNSTAPATEADVVARHSYGRQLGRISDVLEMLIVDRYGEDPKEKKLASFLTMKHQIDKVKQDAAAARIKRITDDLAVLKVTDKKEFERLREGLRDALR